MRKVLVLLILAAGAWYVMRRRRVYAPEAWQSGASTPWGEPGTAGGPSDDGAEPGQGAPGPSGDGRQAATPAQTPPASGVAESSVEPAAAGAAAPADVADIPPAETDAEGEGAPEGQRPRPIAGEGTTTAGGGAVDPLSPTPDGRTSSGVAEPLPPGLAAGEPGTGGPAGSSQAPSVPDSTETPTTGMEHAPLIDREAALERTDGAFVGNKKTRVYHPAGSNHLPAEENRVYFDSEEEAAAAGFRPSSRAGGESAQA